MKIAAAKMLKAVPLPAKPTACVWTKVDTILAVLFALLILASAILGIVYLNKKHHHDKNRYHHHKEPAFEAQRLPHDGYQHAKCKVEDVTFTDNNIPCGQTDEGDWCDMNVLNGRDPPTPVPGPIPDHDVPDWMRGIIEQGRDMLEEHSDNVPEWMENIHEQLGGHENDWIQELQERGNEMLRQLAEHMHDEVPAARNWMSEIEEHNDELMQQLLTDPVLMDHILDSNPGMMQVMMESNTQGLERLCEQHPHIIERTVTENPAWGREFLQQIRLSNPELLDRLTEMIPGLVSLLENNEEHLRLDDAIGDEDVEGMVLSVLEAVGGPAAVEWFHDLQRSFPDRARAMMGGEGGEWLNFITDHGMEQFQSTGDTIRREGPQWLLSLLDEHEEWLKSLAERGADIRSMTGGWGDYDSMDADVDNNFEDLMKDVFEAIGGEEAIRWVFSIQEQHPDWWQEIIVEGEKWMDLIIDNGLDNLEESITSIVEDGPEWLKELESSHAEWVRTIAEKGEFIRRNIIDKAGEDGEGDRYRRDAAARAKRGADIRGSRRGWHHQPGGHHDRDSESEESEERPSHHTPPRYPPPGHHNPQHGEHDEGEHPLRSPEHRPGQHHDGHDQMPLPPMREEPIPFQQSSFPHHMDEDRMQPMPEHHEPLPSVPAMPMDMHVSPCMTVGVSWMDEFGNKHEGRTSLHRNVSQAELFPSCSFVECNADGIEINRKEIENQLSEIRKMMDENGEVPCFVHPALPQAALYEDPQEEHHRHHHHHHRCLSRAWAWPGFLAVILLSILLIRRCYFGCKKTSDVPMKVQPEKASTYIVSAEPLDEEKKQKLDDYIGFYHTTDMSPTNVYVPEAVNQADTPPAYHSLDVSGLMMPSEEKVAPLDPAVDPLKKYMLLHQEAQDTEEKKISLA